MGYKDDNYSSRVCNHHPETCTCKDWDINEKPKQERSYSDEEVNHLQWIYDRLYLIHNENPDYDYMTKFKKIIERTGCIQSEPKLLGVEYTLKDGSTEFVSFQKTLEETARKYASYNFDDHFEAGEWPIEIMYSEEEVKQIIEATLIEYSDYVLADIPEWFEQFKKK